MDDGGGVWKSQVGEGGVGGMRGEEGGGAFLDALTGFDVNLWGISWAAGIKGRGRMLCQANALLHL